MSEYGWPQGDGRVARFVRENGLSLAALILFALSLIGQAVTGFRVTNEERQAHHQPAQRSPQSKPVAASHSETGER